uniref:BHLH domain-containing protein n=1 Tax=Ananas comosus var. bracteatus TaxID=296719 RepID=A0A6V7QET1_ANACO|nr:unnamed protein product [Ananas comosus var. bracteatus]
MSYEMEPTKVVSEINWSSYSPSMQSESEIMAQLLAPFPFQCEPDNPDLGFGAPSFFWSGHATESYYCSENSNPNVYYLSQGEVSSLSGSTSNSSFILPSSVYESCYVNGSNVALGINTCSEPIDLNPLYGEEFIDLSEQTTQPKRKFPSVEEENFVDHGEFDSTAASTKKKARDSEKVQRCAKKGEVKRTANSIQSGDDEALHGQSCSSYGSDNDSNASQEMNGGGSTSSCFKGSSVLNLSGKTRANRGSATDPQSLYARKRRERINERLRILQNLVPNGTKVDISTMLEEAVNYVKFLQLQIKLLSSDELWMYAPIAYNGMNIGIDLKMSPSQQ